MATRAVQSSNIQVSANRREKAGRSPPRQGGSRQGTDDREPPKEPSLSSFLGSGGCEPRRCLKSFQMRPVLAEDILELLQQGYGNLGRRASQFQLGDDLLLPLHVDLALSDMASNHLQICFSFHEGPP